MTSKAAPEQLSFAVTKDGGEESTHVPEAVTHGHLPREIRLRLWQRQKQQQERQQRLHEAGPHYSRTRISYHHPSHVLSAAVITNINMMRHPISQHDVHSCASVSSAIAP